MDYDTLENKVRYVMEHSAESVQSDRALTTAVWRTFYASYINTVGEVAIADILKLPSLQQVQAARRRIQPKEMQEDDHVPWHQQCP